jgi:hypothetical protein
MTSFIEQFKTDYFNMECHNKASNWSYFANLFSRTLGMALYTRKPICYYVVKFLHQNTPFSPSGYVDIIDRINLYTGHNMYIIVSLVTTHDISYFIV